MSDKQPASAAWLTQQEKSHHASLTLMVWISRTFGRRIGRLVLYGIAAYYVLFAPKARHCSRQYLQRALNRWPEWSDGFRHVLAFASTIHDRIYLLNDRFDLFDIEVVGADALLAALEKQPGALLMGAHLGSFEVLRAVGRGQAGLKVALPVPELLETVAHVWLELAVHAAVVAMLKDVEPAAFGTLWLAGVTPNVGEPPDIETVNAENKFIGIF